MSSKARVRVESRRMSYHATDDDKRREGFSLIKKFKRECQMYGILPAIKEKQCYVRPCDKRRQKKQKKLLELKMAEQKGKDAST